MPEGIDLKKWMEEAAARRRSLRRRKTKRDAAKPPTIKKTPLRRKSNLELRKELGRRKHQRESIVAQKHVDTAAALKAMYRKRAVK